MLIISDVHGNLPALEAVLEAGTKLGCHRIVSLGDVAGYYCMLNECIDILRKSDTIHILGNHDKYLLQGTGCPRSRSANVCLSSQRMSITPENMAWLRSSSLFYKQDHLSMVHGGWHIDPLDEYINIISDNYFNSLSGSIFFSGHTHVQYLYVGRTYTYCNPGSVGQPRDGDSRAAFAIVRNKEVKLYRVKYDIDRIANEMKLNGFPSSFYMNLYTGSRIGGGFSKKPIFDTN